MRTSTIDKGFTALGFAIIGMIVLAIPAWITHVVWIIGKLVSAGGPTLGQVGMGVIGAFCPPIGAIHGVMLWFGAGTG